MNTQKVAVLGLGAMGSRVAQRLLQANYPVVVFNRNVNKAKSLLAQGALWAATPKEAAQQADIVISMVTDDQASRTIWLAPETGAMAGLKPEAIAIESSTLSVAWTKALATDLTAQGTAFLDAPVVGSRPQAEAGKLIYLVGGEAATLAQVRGLLLAIGAGVHHVGATGEGMLLKLGVNALFGLQVAALAEMMAILSSYGLTRAKVMECLGALPILSPVAKGVGNLMVNHHHLPLFPIDLVEKDLRYVLQTAEAVEAVAPLATTVRELYLDAISQGYGEDNITKIAALFESDQI